MPQALTPEQVRLVLRRAAELEKRDADASTPQERGIDDREVAEIAAEVGIDDAAVRRALSEMRAGLVVARPPEPSFLDRVVGPAELVYTRRVPRSAASARAAIEAFMAHHVMELKRNLGDEGQIWVAPMDLWSRMRRVLDITKTVAFKRGSEVSFRVVPDGEDAIVSITLRLPEQRQRRAWRVGAGAAMGVGIAAGGIALLHGLPLDLLAAGAGAAAAGGTWRSQRRQHRNEIALAEDAIQRLLDQLEHAR